MPRIVIFGLGFTGAILAQKARAAGYQVLALSRDPGSGADVVCDLAVGPPARMPWADCDIAVVTAPPQGFATGFWPWLQRFAARRLLFGTTSIYKRPGGDVAETTPLEPEHERLPAERDFLASGGEVLRLAGLYGYERNPLYYIKIGRVGYEPRQVNFVHGDDVAAAVLTVLAAPERHSVYNLADGQAHTWQQIIDYAVERGYLRHDRQLKALTRPSASVSPALFLATFPTFRFTDFWSQLPVLAQDQRIAA